MSPTEYISTMYSEDGEIQVNKKSGDFVVCNLSSVNLSKANTIEVLSRLIPIQVRMLDNVIDVNKLPIPQAVITNSRYRAVGLGMFGLHHYFANNQIHWDSDEAVEAVDELTELVAYLTIHSSMELSKEKGAYPYFEGSDWENGSHLQRRGYFEESTTLPVHLWEELQEEISMHGLRNGYLQAPAPNGSTSVIAGSTAALDPNFKIYYQEEKKNYNLPVVAPDLSYKTYEYYKKSAHQMDQFYSVKQRAKIQRNIDQSSSFNLYVPNTINAKVLLELHMMIWEAGIKTSYYTRSTAMKMDECEWCQ